MFASLAVFHSPLMRRPCSLVQWRLRWVIWLLEPWCYPIEAFFAWMDLL